MHAFITSVLHHMSVITYIMYAIIRIYNSVSIHDCIAMLYIITSRQMYSQSIAAGEIVGSGPRADGISH